MFANSRENRVREGSPLAIKVIILMVSCFNLFGLYLLFNNQQSSNERVQIRERGAPLMLSGVHKSKTIE